MEVTRRRRRRKKLLDDLKDRRGYSHLKEEALDCTMWRNRFGGGFEPVIRQITECMNESAPFTIQTVGMQLCTSAIIHYCSMLLQHVKQDNSFHITESVQDDLTRMMSYREVCLCQKIFVCVCVCIIFREVNI